MKRLPKPRFWIIGTFLLILIILNACTPATTTPQLETHQPKTGTPTFHKSLTHTVFKDTTTTVTPTFTPSAASTHTPDLRLRSESWQSWPVLPALSPEMVEVFNQGQRSGRDAHAFSVIGDCQSSPTYFLSLYDEDRYSLPTGEHQLKETIDWYAGSFSHRSISVANGLTAPGALNPRWSDQDKCHKNENPIDCEIRLHNPSVVLISLGTNWHPSLTHEEYLDYLFRIIQTLLENDIVPVLSTKADNMEGDYRRNLAMAQATYELKIPLWNFWATVQHLPNNGLDKTRNDEYLTRKGWDVRNLSALRLLDKIRRQLLDIQE